MMMIAEYVDGRTMEAYPPDGVDELLAICGQVCQGLNALHEAGYVHADIKPHNILRTVEGGVKVIDFGQSCRTGHRKARIQGTPDYIAPEQVRRLPLSQRTDVFNLGATMYWALTGRAYPTDLWASAAAAGVAVVGQLAPQTPRQLDESVPLALSDLVMDCCRPNPADRPADMVQVLKRLHAVAAIRQRGRRPNGPRPSPADRPPPAPSDGRESPDE